MKSVFIAILLCLNLYAACFADRTESSDNRYWNTLPMYGQTNGKYIFTDNDIIFTNDVLSKGKTIKEAYKGFIQLSWDYLGKNDIDTAIKRANQAWLFRQDDYEAYYLFGILTRIYAGKYKDPENLKLLNEATYYHNIALNLNSTNGGPYLDLGMIYGNIITTCILDELPGEVSNMLVSKAVSNYLSAEKYLTEDRKKAMLYYYWTILYFQLGDYLECRKTYEKASKYMYYQNPRAMFSIKNELDKVSPETNGTTNN